ncbi:MAG: nuclear transport factor 2 family protein [Chlamydiota bacterium]|nr:nuclear transport factor 2 family protein [Chlamydiota bacterium]
MQENNIKLAVSYYTSIGKKNLEKFTNLLHPDVNFFAPIANLVGKDAVIEATEHFMNMISSLEIRAKFGSEEQALIIYDIFIPKLAKKISGASLINIKENLITRIELFYDGSLFID